jgi:hypothetical protein
MTEPENNLLQQAKAIGVSSTLVTFSFAIMLGVVGIILAPGASASCTVNVGDCGTGATSGDCTVNLSSSPGYCKNGGSCLVNWGICNGDGACWFVSGAQCWDGSCVILIGGVCDGGSSCYAVVTADTSFGANPGGCRNDCGVVVGTSGTYCDGTCGVVIGLGNDCRSGCNTAVLLLTSC